MNDTIQIDSVTVEVSSLDRVLFPDEGLTKGDLIDYYRRIAEIMLPYCQGRPVTMHRFPNGIHKPGFYQKEAPDYFPDWIERVQIKVLEEDKSQPQVLIQNAASLVYLANQGCITPHVWLSRVDKINYPDRLIFDLDPPDSDFSLVRFTAHLLRTMLEKLELAPYLMTTGSRGLHVVVPLDRSADFDTVRDFARDVAGRLVEQEPDRLTTETRKDKRDDRLFLDYLRNSYAQNAAAPYSVRPKPGAPIATPLDWDELDNADMDSQRYTMQNIFRRLGQKADPWQGMVERAGSIEKARRRLEEMPARSQHYNPGPPANNRNRTAQLEELAIAIQELAESPLYEYRQKNGYHPVPGEGDPHARIMFIGEAPGENEAKAGRPFVGAAGRILNELLVSIGLQRKDVYITNIVKDRPPKNRDPKPDEIALYKPFLIKQIEIIQPRVIATLGRFSMDFVLEQFKIPESGQKISALHGRVLKTQAAYGEVAVVPLFHPAVTLYNQNQKETLKEDFTVLKQFL